MSKIYDLTVAKLGQQIDFDGAYGGQCADVPVYAVWYACGVRLTGNAIDLANQANQKVLSKANVKYQVIENYPEFVPEKGDIGIEWVYAHNFGHTYVVESATQTMVTVLEQNYNDVDGEPYNNVLEHRTRPYAEGAGYGETVCFLRILDGSAPQDGGASAGGSGSSGTAAGNYRVTGDYLNVRSEPSTSGGQSTVVAQYMEGDTVYIEDVKDGWGSYLAYSGKVRYVCMDYLEKM